MRTQREVVPGTGNTYYGVGDVNKVYDTVIEVFDLSAGGSVIASQRVSEALRAFVAPGIAISYREDSMGEPFVQLWNLRLDRAR